jgi:2,4-dienoyl-CoA reductase-like NADH-dependent reductase (Old Yellow Enzyme family)
MSDGPLLFSPIRLRGITARNRIMVSPMCQYASVGGAPTDWHLAHLGRYAMGGAGIVFGEETAVEARGRKTHDCAGIWNAQQARQYRRITDFLRELGAVPAIQIGHCGRNAGTHGAMHDWRPLVEADADKGYPPWRGIAPSAVPAGPGFPPPHAMDQDDIRQVVVAFRDAALRAVDAGYELCELHGAHGYLIHQFLSPVANRRTDGYGGDRSGRMRFALEVTEAVRAAWPERRPLFFRVSAVDGKGGLWGLDDTIALSRELASRGVDAVDCSAGGIRGDSTMALIPRVPGNQVAYAEAVRREAAIPTVAVGLITEPLQAEKILVSGQADIVAMARELMAHADWPVHAARMLGAPDPFGLMPDAYAHRLRRRDEYPQLYPPGCDAEIPLSSDRTTPYRWPDRSQDEITPKRRRTTEYSPEQKPS